MCMRYLISLALTATLPAFAQQVEIVADLEPGGVRQLNATQQHLRETQPREERRRPSGAVVARLVGKMLSEQVKGLNIELNEERRPSAPGLQEQQGALHFNRRAEICYENYRFGVRRGGLMMRYETSF